MTLQSSLKQVDINIHTNRKDTQMFNVILHNSYDPSCPRVVASFATRSEAENNAMDRKAQSMRMWQLYSHPSNDTYTVVSANDDDVFAIIERTAFSTHLLATCDTRKDAEEFVSRIGGFATIKGERSIWRGSREDINARLAREL